MKKSRSGTKKVKQHDWPTWSFSSKFWLPKRRSVPLIDFFFSHLNNVAVIRE